MLDLENMDLDTAAQLAIELEMEYCAENIIYFIKEYGYIEDLDHPEGKSKFDLWPEQERVIKEIDENRLNIILKARQLGITWLVLWYALHSMMFKKGCTVVGLSKKEADAKELVNRLRFMLRNLPKWMIRERRYGTGVTGLGWSATATSVTVHREDGEESRFVAMPATEDAGRSFTASIIILDEWAFQPWAEEIWTSGFPTINRPTGGKVIGLSTAKRLTLFHQIWEEAKDRGFHPIFLSWRADPRRDDDWYEKTLQALGEDKTKQEYPSTPEEAFSAGSDTAFPEFSRSIHVVDPFPIPKHWYRWMSVDNGYNDPFCWLWYAVDEDGTVYVYREYSRDRDDPQVYYTDQGAEVRRLCTYTDIDVFGNPVEALEDINVCVAGLDAWNTHHRDQAGKSLLDYYREGGADFLGFVKAVTDRKLRKATVHEYLKPTFDPNKNAYTSKLKIFSTCKHLIENLPKLVIDENDPEKVEDSAIDNQYDSLGYGLIFHHQRQSRPITPKKTRAERFKEKKIREFRRKQRW